MIQSILPSTVKSFAVVDDAANSPRRIAVDQKMMLFPIEQSGLGRAVEERLQEFRLGRFCARTALTQLGNDWQPIPIGTSREPIWPDGVTGSITHCHGYVAAAVARLDAVYALGIDAELNLPLPDEVVASILTAEELEAIHALPRIGIHWDRLFFSAKESAYKAWFPRQRSWLEFQQCSIRVIPTAQRFEAKLLLDENQTGPDELRIMHGRYVSDARFLVTAVVVPNSNAAIS